MRGPAPAFPFSPFINQKWGALLCGLMLLCSAPSAAQNAGGAGNFSITEVNGRAEQQGTGGTWQALSPNAVLGTGLRTGTGRVMLRSGNTRLLVGSASRLRVYQQEPDFQEGQFLYEGTGSFFALGWHMNLDTAGRVRVDLSPATSAPRVAVLQGRARFSNGTRTFWAKAGEQVSLKTGQVSAFSETDPWYLAQFVEPGAATIEALRGQVQVRSGNATRAAERGRGLSAGDSVTTGAAAWVEIGFTGGGYLRLTELGELNVVSVDKTARGREVTLRLLRGSAWNVVEKGQGGYRITTPVVSTAVRGTTFRVDASGMVKVFEGRVEVPSEGNVTLEAGSQKKPGEATQPLQPDEIDRLNMELDRERAQPLTLQVQTFAPGQPRLTSQRELTLFTRSLPGSDVDVQVGEQRLRLKADGDSGIYRLPTDFALPEGRQQLTVTTRRYEQVQQRRVWVRIDRTAPVLTDLKREQRGRVLELTGEVQDQPGQRTELTVTLPDGRVQTRWLPSGPFRVVLPAPNTPGAVGLTARDPAGNEEHVSLP
ncbi:MAG: FecR family protein [Deinococcus sp.]|uniref:FecR family protein n=1 Tax=Deinococcus sp. TaxID=47478 RepID=UPI0026DB84A8|nr:FecR family protein [Deinococcus sp.]MDO4245747.1 FecR family protein [Deinococcus sp.]